VPFSDAPQSRKSWVPPLQGGWGLGGTPNLGLKPHQAIQISPLRGEGGDEPRPYVSAPVGSCLGWMGAFALRRNRPRIFSRVSTMIS